VEISKETILETVIQAGLAEDDIRWAYSGRGMYGKRCFGIVGSLLDYTAFLLELSAIPRSDADYWDLAMELSQRVSTDNMAYQTIYYFPGVEVVESVKTGNYT
jgi:hypothetical protein